MRKIFAANIIILFIYLFASDHIWVPSITQSWIQTYINQRS